MKENFALILAWIVGLALFGGWMSIVGNPHVVETIIGLIIGIGSGLWIYSKFSPEQK